MTVIFVLFFRKRGIEVVQVSGQKMLYAIQEKCDVYVPVEAVFHSDLVR